MSSPIMMLWLDLRVSTNIGDVPPCSPGRQRGNRNVSHPRGPVRRGQHTGWVLIYTTYVEDVQHSRLCGACAALAARSVSRRAPTVACTSLRAEDGAPITTTRTQPNPCMGSPGTHRRLDRPPARGDRAADPGVQARAGPRAQ